MYDLEALESINVDQIVTVTDRLLHGAVRKRRPQPRASSPVIVVHERTVIVRPRRRGMRRAWLAFATLWLLAAAAACLLV